MIYLVAVLLSIGILLYVLYPIWQKKYRFAQLPLALDNSGVTSLQQLKNEMLMAIKEIDFEYQMEKMSQSDYESLKSEYQNRALQVLKRIDELENSHSKDEDIEAQIRVCRQQLKEQSRTNGGVHYCPNCGEKAQPHFKFCVNCGQKLQIDDNLETRT